MPKRSKDTETDVSLRLKYGIHTIFLLVTPFTTFDEITAELLDALRERYPKGMSSSLLSHGANDTPIPPADEEHGNDEISVRYGVLPSRHNRDTGWRDLNVVGTETPLSKSIRDSTDIAFVIYKNGEEPPSFVVEWPKLDDEEEEEEEEEEGGEGEE